MADAWNTIHNLKEVVHLLKLDVNTEVFVYALWRGGGEHGVNSLTIQRIKRAPLLIDALLDDLIEAMPPEEIPFTDPPDVDLGPDGYIIDA